MPLYSAKKKWSKKAERVLSFILETGNFGHNRDKSYYEKYPVAVYKAISLWRNTSDSLRLFMIFPKDAARAWFIRLKDGVLQVVRRGRSEDYGINGTQTLGFQPVWKIYMAFVTHRKTG